MPETENKTAWITKDNMDMALKAVMVVGFMVMLYLQTQFPTKVEFNKLSEKVDTILLVQANMGLLPQEVKEQAKDIKDIDKRVTILEVKQK